MNSNITISPDYLLQQKKLHMDPAYGVASLSFSPIIADIVKRSNINSLTDYGAGKKRLFDGLKKSGISIPVYQPYDPVFPEYGQAKSADLVCCIDVLEHVEPELLENVLQELHSITVGIGFFTIHMGPAKKILTDGRNAHLIQKESSWWLRRICRYFNVIHLQSHSKMGPGIWLIVNRVDKIELNT